MTEHAQTVGAAPTSTTTTSPRSHAEVPELDRRAELALFGLALLMAPVVVVQVSWQDPTVLFAAELINFVIWVAFAAEIAYLVLRARDRVGVLRARWLDVAIVLLAPPFIVPPELASLRLLRMIRLLRLFAIAMRLRHGGAKVLGTEGLVYVGFVVFLVVFVGGVGLYELEPETVPSVWAGFWFMLATLTTVGYGDIAPQTFEGRVLASIGMLVGLGSFAALTAAVTQMLFRPASSTPDPDRLAQLERRIDDLAGRVKNAS